MSERIQNASIKKLLRKKKKKLKISCDYSLIYLPIRSKIYSIFASENIFVFIWILGIVTSYFFDTILLCLSSIVTDDYVHYIGY